MTVNNNDAATDNASPGAIYTTTHTPNSATAPDAAIATAENKIPVRQLLEG